MIASVLLDCSKPKPVMIVFRSSLTNVCFFAQRKLRLSGSALHVDEIRDSQTLCLQITNIYSHLDPDEMDIIRFGTILR